MTFKPSYYNHVIPHDNQFVIFNSKSLATALLGHDDYQAYHYIINHPEENHPDYAPLKEDMIQGGYLIPADQDEKLEIQQRMLGARNNRQFCSLTIAPTMGCNFNCDYCFESEEVRADYSSMSTQVQDKLIEMLHEHIKTNHTKFIELTWFGGEPLLAMKAIENISKHILALCEQYDIQFKADMTTNGYRLSAKVGEILKACEVKTVQVTIDGPECIHDQRRVLKGGKGSFKKIIKGIVAASKFTKILIRVNVDKNNVDYLNQFFQEVKPHVINNDNINIVLAPVTGNPFILEPHKLILDGHHFAEVDLNFVLQAYEQGKNIIAAPKLLSNVCGADQKYSYMIGPAGELYQCWDDFGDYKMRIGDIFNPNRHNTRYVNEYMDFDPTQHPKCSDCTVMPLCMGGCPKQRLLNDNVPQCGLYKYNLKERVLATLGELPKQPLSLPYAETEFYKSVRGYNNYFHIPVKNNYVYILTPKTHILQDYLDSIKRDTFLLNVADEALFYFCEELLKNDENCSSLLANWRTAITGSANLNGVYAASKLTEYLEKNTLHTSLGDYLKENQPAILEKFLNVPNKMLKLIRINAYIGNDQINDYLQKIINLLNQKPAFYKLIERIEIAQENLANHEKTTYPHLIIYLSSNITLHLEEFMYAIKNIFSTTPNTALNANNEYAFTWGNTLTLTQGYKLYKRYLAMTGLLDDVYESTSNHAFHVQNSNELINLIQRVDSLDFNMAVNS